MKSSLAIAVFCLASAHGALAAPPTAKRAPAAAAPAADSSAIEFDEEPAASGATTTAAPAASSAPALAPAEEAAEPAAPGKASRVVTLTQSGKALAWPSELKWARFKTPKGRSLRGPLLKVEVPKTVAVDTAETTLDNGGVLSATKTNEGSSLRLQLSSLKDVLHLPKTAAPVDVAIKLEKSKIDTSVCAKLNLKIEQIGAVAKTPYYMFFTCQRRAGRIIVAFSHPLELETLSSTALEREGKGEGYKVYELTTSANLGKEGELIRFEFRINGETQKFRVSDSQRTGKNEEAKEPIFVYRAGLGAGQYGLTAPGRSQTSIQPHVSAEFRTAPFFGRFAGSGGVFLSPGIAFSGDSQTYLGFEVGLGYRIGGAPKGQAFYFEPSARFYAIHQEYTKLGISAHHNQPGAGLVLGNKGALDPSGFEISIGASGYGVTDQASHLDAGFRYAFLVGTVPSGVGLTYAQQQQTAPRGSYDFQRLLLSYYFWP